MAMMAMTTSNSIKVNAPRRKVIPLRFKVGVACRSLCLEFGGLQRNRRRVNVTVVRADTIESPFFGR